MSTLLPVPSRDPQADYDLALSHRRHSETQKVLLMVRKDIFAAYSNYDLCRGGLKIRPLNFAQDVSTALRENYRSTYKGAALSAMRDTLMAAVPLGVCPLCRTGSIATLDHYLPKDTYPEFALLSLNLVPSCRDCNFMKANLVGSSRGGRFIHAYYDNLPEVALFEAHVEVGDSVVVSFVVNPRLPNELLNNVRFHFDRLELAQRYSLASAIELFDQLPAFQDVYEVGGTSGLLSDLRRRERHRRGRLGVHHWKSALYSALAKSSEFQAEGFLRIERREVSV